MSQQSGIVFKVVAGTLCLSFAVVFMPFITVPMLIGFGIWRWKKKGRQPSKKEIAAAAREVGAVSGSADGPAWSYSCSRFELAIDFDRDQAVLTSLDPKAKANARSDAPVEAMFTQVFHASELSLACLGYGETKSILVSWSKQEASFFGVESKWDGDAIRHLGSAEMTVIDPKRPNFRASFDDVPPTLSSHLEQRLEPIENRLRAMVNARAAAALVERRSFDDWVLRSKKETAMANATRAKARLDEAKALAGLGESFEDFGVGDNGALAWAIAVDKMGNAVIEAGGESWAGSLIAARAKASIIEAAPISNDVPAVLEFELELADKDYEREHLAKRRFKLMRGWPRDKLRAWTDRVELLASIDPHADIAAGGIER